MHHRHIKMSSDTKALELPVHGWTAVPRSQAEVIATLGNPKPSTIVVEDVKQPDSQVARKTYV